MTSPVHSTRNTSHGEPQRRRRHPSAALAFAGVVGVVTFAVALDVGAQTQTTTGTIQIGADNVIERVVPYRKVGNKPYWISYSDCVLNDVFTFPLKVTNVSRSLEVWVGSSDCVTARPQQDMGQCWLVARVTPNTDIFDLEVPVRNVVARITNSEDVPKDLPASVCDQSTESSGESFTYYFMQVNSGQVTASAKWQSKTTDGTGFDMIGPEPPEGVGVGVGESQLDLRLSGINEEADRERFRAFCVPAGTAGEDAVDAGAVLGADVDGGGTEIVSGASDAGTTTTTTEKPSPAECANGVLFQNRRAPVNSQYECGQAAVISSSIRTDRLQNGVTYALAVAGEDAIGNTGKLSEIQCGTPTLLDDFFELYSRSGGPGGGGFCSLMPGAASGVPLLPSLGVASLALGLVLRRRRAR